MSAREIARNMDGAAAAGEAAAVPQPIAGDIMTLLQETRQTHLDVVEALLLLDDIPDRIRGEIVEGARTIRTASDDDIGTRLVLATQLKEIELLQEPHHKNCEEEE
jgi:hypothetical protein